VELAFARLGGDRAKAIYVASGPLGPIKRARIIAFAAESRLPVIYSFRSFALEGGLISFAADYGDLFRRAAGYVDKILKGPPICRSSRPVNSGCPSISIPRDRSALPSLLRSSPVPTRSLIRRLKVIRV
jgi:hypothetical protein